MHTGRVLGAAVLGFVSLQLLGCATMRAHEPLNRDRVVVIAGSSSGFGKGVALRLADQGARLVLAARRIELLIVDINLNGIINGSHYALRQFRRQQEGVLINIASMAGRVGLPYYASYSATKHAIVGLGTALNQELRRNRERNIHVSTIMPYASDTPWWQHAANYSGHEPSMILMDPPEKIIDAIVRATVAPRPEVAVGWKAKAKAIAGSHRLLRRATDTIAGEITHRQLVKGAPTPPTTGSLYEPTAAGGGIRSDRRRR